MSQLSLPAKARLAIYSVFLLLASVAPSFCAPSLIAPQDTVYLSTVSPTFYWSDTTPNYQLQVDNNSDFSSPAIDIVTSSISYTAPAALLHGVTYYWHVKDSAWSGSYSFSIDTTAPTAVSYRSISSTGGVIGESQFSDLISGVTVQINISDVLSGLAVTTTAYPSGGHGVICSTNAGQTWLTENMSISYNGAQEYISSLAAYDGKLYAGQAYGIGDGNIYVFDGNTWSLSYDGANESIHSLAVYDGKLYAGQGTGGGDGDVYVFDGATWSLSYNGVQQSVYSLAVYNGKLYAGQGGATGGGDVYVFDGTTWSLSYDGAQEYIFSLAVYNGKLYAGQGNGAGDGDVYVFDGATWSLSYNGAQESIYSLAAYNGKLYAGQGISAGDGDIYVFNGAAWSLSYNGVRQNIFSLAVYNGKLYAGQGSGAGDGDIYVLNGTTWSLSYNGAQESIYSLAAYNGKLYAGQGISAGDGDVFSFSPMSSVTGTDGSTAVQTLSATVDLALSTNTQTCGGVSPCGATNQVKFFASDLAGNVAIAGPYAIIANPSAKADAVTATYSTGVVNASSITFTSYFKLASYYRYVWDNSATHTWIFSESVWNAGPMAKEFSADGTWYLHVLPYTALNSSGTPRDIGPFNVDRVLPVAASYRHISSTGGVLGESQFTSLTSGVTVQMDMQDLLSGLAVSTTAYPSGGHGVIYTRDSGQTWLGGDMELSFDGLRESINSMAVYNGKLYAGQGFINAGLARVYVFDGSSWALSYTGAERVVYSLAAYDGKLYAGMGYAAGEGDIYVFDGVSWSRSYNADSDGVFSMAVYNGKLYAGMGDDAGEGDVYAFDGTAWARVYDSAAYKVYALTVYNGKLYAAMDDVYVFDGLNWTLSYNAAVVNFVSLGVYNGKLYAGCGSSAGYGDIYAFNGNTWSLSYDGAEDTIYSFAAADGKLYASEGEGNILVFGGAQWLRVRKGTNDLPVLITYEGRLYAGRKGGSGEGDVLRFSPVAVSSLTGTDGSTGIQTLSANLDLSLSTNTETCNGASGCGATNQVLFFASDLAGNSRIAGPYAVLSYSPDPLAGEVKATYSTGSWVNASSITFTSAFQKAAYYRYVWNNSPSHAWSFSEALWTPGTHREEFVSDGVWYLHVLPYSILGSSGPALDLGPFNVDRVEPSAAAYGHFDSLGGFKTEAQFNDLISGVTVQMSVQDLLSGLIVSDAVTPGENITPPGGFSVAYSKNAGLTWAAGGTSISLDSNVYSISSMAVYDGKLYAGLGELNEDNDGDGDIYVFDGASWSLSYDGGAISISALAVYDGKLYAAQSSWDVTPYLPVFDGISWNLSYCGEVYGTRSLAVYNGKLYAGELYGEGVYEFDGQTWRLSLDGINASVSSFAVYNGKLYAGQGYDGSQGEGDVYVYDGDTWSASFDGTGTAITALAVYDGKLYAGVYNSPAAYAEIYVFDGTTWTLSAALEGDDVNSLAVYRGLLYAAPAYAPTSKSVYAFDGVDWKVVYAGEGAIVALAAYQGSLYAAQSVTGNVLKLAPVEVSSMTGADGTSAPQTLQAYLDLTASTNTETCGGAAPCGATNQVRFSVTDMAGNVKTAGPFAVIAIGPPSAADVVPARSTAVWYSSGAYSFAPGVSAMYYRYIWDQSPAHTWTETEPQWSGADLDLYTLSEGDNWYLHLLPYNLLDSSGTSREIGPFYCDISSPAFEAFRSVNSTGGALAETAFNNLLAGVTLQIGVQDIFSGLYAIAVSSSDYLQGFETGIMPAGYSTGGAAVWAIDGAVSRTGSYSVRSGTIGDGAASWLQMQAECMPGNIVFFRKVSSEADWDYLRFYIDGEEKAAWSGELDWAEVSFPVAAGIHTFKWEYSKDSDCCAEGNDAAWVDDILLPMPPVSPYAEYSTDAGQSWTTVSSTAAASAPRYSISGANGSQAPETMSVFPVDLAVSTNTEICSATSPCGATNQIKFYAVDMLWNLKMAGPYAILVDTLPTAAITDLSTSAVYHSSVTLTWTAPADTGQGVGAVTAGWYRIDYATYPGYAFSPEVYKLEFSTQAVIGEQQAFSAEGLCPYSTYYFSVYAGDRAYNFPVPSNIAAVKDSRSLDCGLRIFDGNAVVSLACEFPPSANSQLRIYKSGNVYGVILFDADSPCEVSKLRIQTPAGIKAVKKY